MGGHEGGELHPPRRQLLVGGARQPDAVLLVRLGHAAAGAAILRTTGTGVLKQEARMIAGTQ